MTKPHLAGKRVIDLEVRALTSLSESLGAEFDAVIRRLTTLEGCLIVSGMGKSGHVGRKIAATLSSTGTIAMFLHPGEASHGDLGIVGADDIVLALSRSGETSELSDLIAHVQDMDVPLIAITTRSDSTLARTADHALILPDIAEACAITSAPTTSTTMMLALGDAIAVSLLEQKNFTEADFRRYHPGGSLGAMLSTVADLMWTGDQLPLVQPGTSMADALFVMGEKKLGCVGIAQKNGPLIGILTDGDVRRIVTDARNISTIDKAMNPDPLTLKPDMRALEAVKILNERGISQAFITRNGRPIGIVHMHDFLRAQIK